MALNKRSDNKKKFKPPALMLTSMMDMFTIILIFLLFSFSKNAEKIDLGKDIDLPRSSSTAEYSKSVKLILTKKDLRLNDEIMATMQGGKLTGLSEDDPEASSLYRRLKSYRGEIKSAEDGGPAAGAESPHVLFLCDKSYEFSTINRVIKTAGLAGYPNFQFAVLQEK